MRDAVGAVALALWLCTSISWAGPTDGQVVSGEAAIEQSGSTFNINQSTDRAIVHWQDFSIDSGQTVRFNLPQESSAVLNRVTSNNISQIHGLLESNGRVFLINPNGVLIGPGGQIQTHGFVASTLDVDDAAFMSGGDLLFAGPSDAGIVNQGSITAVGGDIILIARTVENHGTLSAPDGTVGIAAGTEILLQDNGEDRLLVRVGGDGASIHNTGNIEAVTAELKATGGNIYALAINNDGLIRATGVEQSEGRIYLVAENAGVGNAGALEAHGGEVRVLGDEVTLASGSLIDVSGTSEGGGIVLVGGSFQGNNPDILNSTFTMVDFESVILADAGEYGDGGTVIIWSDVDARFGGSISARGGTLGGDGGFVEVSGKQYLTFRGHVDVIAPLGDPGSLLLDPENVTIASGVGASPPTADWDDRDVATSATIYEDDMEAFVGVLYVSADNNFVINNLADNELTLQATSVSLMANNETGLTVQGGFMMDDLNDTIRLTSAGAPLTIQGGQLSGIGTRPGGASIDVGPIITNGGAVSLITKRLTPALPIYAQEVTTNGGNFRVDRIDASNSDVVDFTAEGLIDTGGGNVTVSLVGTININAGINVGAGLLSFSGTNTNLNSAITATGNVSINSVLNFGAGSSISTDGTITFTSTASMLPGGSLTLSGSDFDFQDTFTGNTATLTLRPNLVGGNMAINAATFGNLSGFSLVSLGRADGTGAATLTGAIAIVDPLTVIMGGAGGTITQDGTVTGSDDASVIYTAGSTININDTISVPAGLTFTAPTVNVNDPIDAGSGDVTLTGTNLNIGAALAGTGSLYIRPNAVPDDFTVTASTFLNLNGFASYTIGRTDGTGTATIAGVLAISDPLTILIGGVGGSIHQTGNVVGADNASLTYTAGGTVTVDGTVDVPDGVTLTGPNVVINAAMDAGAGDITLTAGTLAINDTLTATGNLLIVPTDSTSTIGLGDGAVGTLHLSTAEITDLQPGFASITIGAADGSGDIDIRIADFTSPLTIRTPTGDGDIIISDAMTSTDGITLTAGDTITITTGSIATDDGDVTLDANGSAGGGMIVIQGDIITDGGAINLSDAAYLAADLDTSTVVPGRAGGNVTFSSAVLLNNAAGVSITTTGVTGDGNVLFSGTLDSDIDVTPLTIDAGNVNFNAALGALASVGSMDITTSGTLTTVAAADAIISGSFTHGGSGSASLTGDITTTAGSITFNSPVAINTPVTFIAGGAGADFNLNNDLTKSVGVASTLLIQADDRIVVSSGSSIVSTSGAMDITLVADLLDMTDATLQSTGYLVIRPRNAGVTIGLGNGATGTLNLTAAELSYLQDGFASITFGNSAAGNIDVRAWTVDDPVTLITTDDVTINGALAVTVNGLTIDSDGEVTQTAPIATDALLLLGAGVFTLNDPGNDIGRLAASLTGGSLLLVNGGTLLVGSVYGVDGVTNTGSTVTLIADGVTSDVTLDEAVAGTDAGTSVVLVAGRNFINNVGAAAIDPGAGRFLVYSTDPADNTLNGLVAGKLYNRNYIDDPPPTIATPGDLLLYSIQPTLTITADDKTKVYGSANPAFTYTPTGFIDGDTAVTALAGAPSLTTIADGTSGVGFYSIDAATGTLTSPLGYALNFVNGQLEITPAALTITANDASRVYGAADPAFTADYSGFVNGDDASVVSGLDFFTPATVFSPVGDYALTPLSATAANYTITFVDGTLSITPATLTITADDASRTYGAANPAFTANYSGFVNGEDSSIVSGLTFSTPATVLSPVGDYAITPADATAPNYNIVFADGTLTVTQASLTITADDDSRQYGTANPAFTAGYSGFLNGDDASVVSGLDFTTPATIASSVGNYDITPFGATATNYAITFVDGTLTVTQAPLTITADDASRTYGAADPAFTANYVGFLNGDDASVVSGLTFSTPATVLSPVGDYALSPADAVATNYSISFVDGTLSVTPATLTITADDLARTYGSANPPLTVNYSGFVNGEDDSVVSGLNVTTPATVLSSVGDYAITPADATAPNYNIVFVDGTLTVTQALLTITADDDSRQYGTANPAFTAGYSGFLNGDDASVVSGLDFTTPATIASSVGDYAITPFGATATNYAVTFVDGTLTVTQAPLTITADDASRAYGAADPAFTANYVGFLNGDDASVVSGLTFSTPATVASPIGDYALSPADAVATNYSISFVDGTLTITPATLTVTADDDSRQYGTANPAFTANYSGFVNGEDDSIVSGLTFSTPATVLSPVGDYAITPADATAPNYNIVFVDGTLTVTQAPLTITADDDSRQYGTANPAFTANYSGFVNGDDDSVVSGLTISTPATITSSVGDYDITPADAVAANYAVTFVDGTLTVTQAPLTITADDASRAYGAADPTFTANYSGFLNGDDASVVLGLDFSTPATVLSPVGDYALTPADAIATNYSISFVDGTLSVTPATLTITADDLARTYGSANPPLTVNYSGFVNGEDDSIVSGLSVSTPAVLGSPVGDYAIAPADAVASNYNIVFVDGTLTVAPATLTITADDASRLYGAANPVFTANYSGFVNGEDSSIVSGLNLSTPADAGSSVGDYAITPADASALNYVVVFQDGTLTVNPAPLTITANDAARIYGATDPAFTADYSGFLNGDDASVVTGLEFDTVGQTTGIGDYDIAPVGAVAGNYDISFVNGTLTITPAALTIIADDKARILNQPNPPLTASYFGLMPWDDPSVVTGLVLTTTADIMSVAGEYPIFATGGTADNYTITHVNGVSTILLTDLFGVQEIIQQNDRKLTDQFNTILTEQPIGAPGRTVTVATDPPADLASSDNDELSAPDRNYRIYYRITDSDQWTITYGSDKGWLEGVLAADSSFNRTHVSTGESATASVNPAGLNVE